MASQQKIKLLSAKERKQYFKKYGDRLVYIQSNHGIWKKDAKGYTDVVANAWILPLSDAYAETEHCGPEKQVQYVYYKEPEQIELLSSEEKTVHYTADILTDQALIEYSDES